MWKLAFVRLLCLLPMLHLSAAVGPRFEVVSIHPSPDDAPFFAKPPANGKFLATGIVARLMVMFAFNVQESQIADGPSWITSDRWNVEAKSEAGGKNYSPEESRQMLQNMLQARFTLRAHRETHERPAYVLTIAKGGPKLKASESGTTNIRVSGNSISLEGGDIPRMIQLLSSALGKPVVDQTGLNGRYDISLQWDDAPVPDGGILGLDAHSTSDPNRGSIFSAIQNQLGLRLVSQQAPVEIIVIDKIERPSEN